MGELMATLTRYGGRLLDLGMGSLAFWAWVVHKLYEFASPASQALASRFMRFGGRFRRLQTS